MSGCVIEATPIAVDFWKPVKAAQARLFFLTHLHADHTEGLTSSWRLPIYTSPTNASLLKQKYKLPDSILRKLEVGESYIIPLCEESNITITVTVLDANHVPGAVMFLFQGYFGNILYCGDMRWNPEMLKDPVLYSVVQHRELDVLYLDNTYSAPYCQFPSREEAKQQIFTIIDEFPDHEIKIGVNNIGRESLLEEIATRYGERILVSVDRYERLQLLGRLDVFTTDPEQSRIHAVPMNQITVASHNKWNQKYQTISILPTALFVGWKGGPYSSQISSGLLVVHYSDHSSYSELMDMVTQLAPRQIYPIVRYWSKSGWWSDPSAPDQGMKADMTVYRHLLTVPPPDPVHIPEPVIRLMNTTGPRLLHSQPRRCFLRHGLSPRRSKMQGAVYTPSVSHSLPPLSYTPSTTPVSVTSLRSSTSGFHSQGLAGITESSRTPKHRAKSAYSKHVVETPVNEIHGAVGASEMHPERNAPIHSSDLPQGTGMPVEEGQHIACKSPRGSVNYRNSKISKRQGEHVESSAKRRLSLPSEENTLPKELQVNLRKEREMQRPSSMRRMTETVDPVASKSENLTTFSTVENKQRLLSMRNTLLKQIADFLTDKTEKLAASSSTENVLHVMVQDSKLLLESLSFLENLS